jgi:hypothetical protein
VSEQLQMGGLLEQADAEWFRARAPEPSWLVPCAGGCGREAWVSARRPEPLCWYCLEEKGDDERAA